MKLPSLTAWIRPADPWSALTGASYGLTGGALLLLKSTPATIVFAAFMALLSVGTIWFHWKLTRISSDLDHAGMAGLLTALVVALLGGGWILMLAGGLAAIGLLVYTKATAVNDQVLAAVNAFYALVRLRGMHQWWLLAGAVAFMGFGFWIWHRKGDRAHAVWHVSEDVGFFLLAAAVFL